MADLRETGRSMADSEPKRSRAAEKLAQDFRKRMEKFLSGGGFAGRMACNDFSFENYKVGSIMYGAYREKLTYPGQPLFANDKGWPKPPLSGSTAHAYFLKKGEDLYLSLQDNFRGGLFFSLEEGRPDVRRMNFTDPRTEPFVHPKLRTPAQKLRYGLFLLSCLETVRPKREAS